MKPFSPKEVCKKANKKKRIPDEVINAVNTLLIKNYNTRGSTIIRQNELIALILENNDYTREQIFENEYLNFEEVFESAGWRVEYDKPGYSESYDAYWKFYPFV